MTTLVHTSADHVDFLELVKELDAELKIRDGEEHSFYAPHNKLDKIIFVTIAFHQNMAVGCGALKEFSVDSLEVKRMYVHPENRGHGIAGKILNELENQTAMLGYSRCVLETGKNQPEAISLYEKNGYKRIPNYGPYQNISNSVCFEKKINPIMQSTV
ncbi:MAG: GNAT family N-acetyltransferase [Saprospiraceae bacterium]|nr:GNAT family N-acetyltransferase [Candidatus Vicinibacter affinis]